MAPGQRFRDAWDEYDSERLYAVIQSLDREDTTHPMSRVGTRGGQKTSLREADFEISDRL